MRHKTIDLGEYIIEIDFNPENNDLDISVFDALGEIIESMNISDDDDDDDDDDYDDDGDDKSFSGPLNISFNLN